MRFIIIFFSTLFFHIWDDFGRQGIMASMKQKSWWKSQKEYSDMYRYDWIPALVSHSFSWAFMISIPSFVYCYFVTNEISPVLIVTMLLNCVVHFVIDDLKCNKLKINLCVDQILHCCQILAETVVCCLVVA